MSDTWNYNSSIGQIVNSNKSKLDKTKDLRSLQAKYKNHYDSFTNDFNRVDGIRKEINVRCGCLIGAGAGLSTAGIALILNGVPCLADPIEAPLRIAMITIGGILIATGATCIRIGITFLAMNVNIIDFTDQILKRQREFEPIYNSATALIETALKVIE
ncbi:MAG: conserved hypothetical protein [Methanobrevibacter sp. CfCl-M3]